MSAIRNSLLLTIMLAAASIARAGDWPQWRGPFFNGSTDETNLPSRWSKTENIAWKVELPGAAAATPIISGGQVFLSGADPQRDVLLATCYDRTSGKRLWQHDLARGIRKDFRSTFAARSSDIAPVSRTNWPIARPSSTGRPGASPFQNGIWPA